ESLRHWGLFLLRLRPNRGNRPPKTITRGKSRLSPMAQLAIAGGTPVRTKPAPSWPIHTEEEERRILDVVRSGKWWFGENVKAFEEEFAAFQDARFGITCPNGTIGLILALKALGIDAGDEVIVPAYSFF